MIKKDIYEYIVKLVFDYYYYYKLYFAATIENHVHSVYGRRLRIFDQIKVIFSF